MQHIHPTSTYSHRACLFVVSAIVLALLFSPDAVNADALFTVKEYSYCGNVKDLVPVDPYENPAEIRKGNPLWIWMEIDINRYGYAYLKRFGKFPVHAAWGKDGRLIGRLIDVGINSEQWEKNKHQIDSEFKSSADSTFRWRTRAARDILAGGEYYISILDANRKAVTASDDDVMPFRPKITLQVLEK